MVSHLHPTNSTRLVYSNKVRVATSCTPPNDLNMVCEKQHVTLYRRLKRYRLTGYVSRWRNVHTLTPTTQVMHTSTRHPSPKRSRYYITRRPPVLQSTNLSFRQRFLCAAKMAAIQDPQINRTRDRRSKRLSRISMPPA